MDNFDYDLLVLGAGSGGLATAKRAAMYGARVAVVEDDRVGGTCVIRGCVPKKLMVYAAEFGHALEDAKGYGWNVGDVVFDWARLRRDRDAAVARLESRHEELLEQAGVTLLRGRGRLVGPQEATVGGRRIRARYLLLSVGGAPVFPDVEGVECAVSSDGFFELSERPDRVAVVGGGYIGCELAGILRALGSEVSIIYRRDLPLAGFDGDVRREVAKAMQAAGIDVRSETVVARIRRELGGVVLDLHGGGRATELSTDQALVYATGRRPRTDGLGLQDVGVEVGVNGEVVSDVDGRTAVESILAVGDCTGRAALTPVAIQAGRAIADRVFGGLSTRMSYEDIPTAVFSDPPVGTVGLGEEEAVALYGADNVRVYRERFTPMLHMLTERKTTTMVKLVVKADDERVLGCHVFGHDAPEIIQGFAVAVKMGATKADFDRTVGIHPSTAEELVTLR